MSRETALLVNNVLLVVTAASILLGTLYPLVLDALGVGKISVGPPYFNSVFIPLTAPLAVLVGIDAMARWKQDSLGRLGRQLTVVFIISVIAGVMYPVVVMPYFSVAAAIGMVLAFWVAASTVVAIRDRLGPHGNWRHIPRGFWGMVLGHTGIAVFIVGVTLTSLYSTEKDVRLTPGETYEMGGYSFEFRGVKTTEGPNYTAFRGNLLATRDGELIAEMHPEKRIYRVQTMPMTEAAIDPGLTRDRKYGFGKLGPIPYLVIDTGGVAGGDAMPRRRLPDTGPRHSWVRQVAVGGLVDGGLGGHPDGGAPGQFPAGPFDRGGRLLHGRLRPGGGFGGDDFILFEPSGGVFIRDAVARDLEHADDAVFPFSRACGVAGAAVTTRFSAARRTTSPIISTRPRFIPSSGW